jgi:hypothetical protein
MAVVVMLEEQEEEQEEQEQEQPMRRAASCSGHASCLRGEFIAGLQVAPSQLMLVLFRSRHRQEIPGLNEIGQALAATVAGVQAIARKYPASVLTPNLGLGLCPDS